MPQAALTPRAFAEAAGVSRETLARLELHAALLAKFQRAVNLVSAESMRDVWRRHFLDSAQLMPFLPAVRNGGPLRLLDLGSGAGFPGLVLAIMGMGAGRDIEAHLVEADARKAAFLREVARRTAAPVTIHNRRIEQIPPFPVDVVTARALAPLPRLLALAAPFLGPPAPLLLLLKGRTGAQELTQAREEWMMHAETIPSITDPRAVVLRIEDIRRV